MDIQLINIGFGNIISANRVITIVSPESAPIKRVINDGRERGQLIDATYGCLLYTSPSPRDRG